MKKLKLPKFKDEDAERDFWAKIDLGDYYQAKDFSHVPFPNLKPSTQPISLRLPISIIHQVKIKAYKMDVPYQSLMKQYIADGLKKE